MLDKSAVKSLWRPCRRWTSSAAKIIGLLQAPATKVAGVLQAPAGQLARVVRRLRRQRRRLIGHLPDIHPSILKELNTCPSSKSSLTTCPP